MGGWRVWFWALLLTLIHLLHAQPHVPAVEEGVALPHILQEEIQLFRDHLTTAYAGERTRRRRAFKRYMYDVKFEPAATTFAAPYPASQLPSLPFLCNGTGLVLQNDGLFRLEGFWDGKGESSALVKVRGTEGLMGRGEKLLGVTEWEKKCFLLIGNQNGTLSSLYTLHGEKLTPVLRQQIRNVGVVTAAEFFLFKSNLYLVITYDNAAHSLTNCPVLRWTGTYMDEIHTIQTRGAISVETFTINGKLYISIAQAQDSTGNYEVGTQILRMDDKEYLEKVQLLYSNHPVALEYFQVKGEHYLLIVQAKEPSMLYVFGGIDFIPAQDLDLTAHPGSTVFVDSFLSKENLPILLAAKGNTAGFYRWSETSSSLVKSTESSQVVLAASNRVVGAKFLRVSEHELYLTLIQTKERSQAMLVIIPIRLEKRELGESQVQVSESKLGQCLDQVRKLIQSSKMTLPGLLQSIPKILTLHENQERVPLLTINSTAYVGSNPTPVESVIVDVDTPSANHVPTPSRIMQDLQEYKNMLQRDVRDQIPYLLMTNREGNVTGKYIFENKLEIRTLNAPSSDLTLKILNGRKLEDIKNYALKKDSLHDDVEVSGNWTIGELSAENISIFNGISGVKVDDFLLTSSCPTDPDGVPLLQEISGTVIFKQEFIAKMGILMPVDATINGVRVSNIALKNGPVKTVFGYKTVKNLNGKRGMTFTMINGKNFPKWYDTVLHIDGPPQQTSGGKISFAAHRGDQITKLQAKIINNYNWDEFADSLLLNGPDQDIDQEFFFSQLEVQNLSTEKIGSTFFKDLLSGTNNKQFITSNITISMLTVLEDLETNLINSELLMSLAISKWDKEVSVEGEVTLENVSVAGNVTLSEGVTVSGKDVSELAKLRRKQIYFTRRDRPIVIRSSIQTDTLTTNSINNLTLSKDLGNFWTRSESNIIPGPLQLKNRKVRVLGPFETGSINGWDMEKDFVHLNEGVPITTKLRFLDPVVIAKHVVQNDGKTLNGFDISELTSEIVRVGDGRKVTGTKLFRSTVVIEGPATLDAINGVRIPDDLVLLNSPMLQEVGGVKEFKTRLEIAQLVTDANILVDGSVNGVSMRELNKTTAYKGHGPIRIKGNLDFLGSVEVTDLHVEHNLNGTDVADLLKQVIYLSEPQVLRFPVRILTGNVIVGDSQIITINGVNVKEYLNQVLMIDENDRKKINGTKTFTSLFVEGNVLCPAVNGISLVDLKENAFYLNNDQNVTGKFVVQKLIFDGDLKVKSIDGVSPDDYVYVNDDESCTVSSDLVFRNNVTVEDLSIKGSINGFPIQDLEHDQGGGVPRREFAEVEVVGALAWNTNRNDTEGMSHLFDNAVTLDTDQDITGSVTFASGFEADSLISDHWIDGVDLNKISEDAVLLSDDVITLEGKVSLSKELKITTGSGGVSVANLKAKRIHGVALDEFLSKVVRRDAKGVVFGLKRFPKGLQTEEFTFKNLNERGNYSWLIHKGDARTLEHVQFSDLVVNGDFDYDRADGFDLEGALSSQLTRGGRQTIKGDLFVPSLVVEEGCDQIQSLNGIPVSDVVLRSELQGDQDIVISGRKTFTKGLTVEGNVLNGSINGIHLSALKDDVYNKDQEENFSRPVIFLGDVYFNKSLAILEDLNTHRPKDLKEKIAKTLEQYKTRARIQDVDYPRPERLTSIQKIRTNITRAGGFWLEHMRLRQNWSEIGPQQRVEWTPTAAGGIVSLHYHPDAEERGVGTGCQCNTVRFINVGGPDLTASPENVFPCTNAFMVSSPRDSHVLYSIFDESSSFNRTCVTKYEGQLTVTVISPGTDNQKVLLVAPSKGYLSDVKIFSDAKLDYLVLAYYYDQEKNTHNTSILVYQVAGDTLIERQKIAAAGPVRMDLQYLRNDVLLAVANGRDPNTGSCNATSAVYKWDMRRGFTRFQGITTNGAVDVALFEVEDLEFNGQISSFLAFAQSGNSGDGEVILYRSRKSAAYEKFQSLRTPWKVTGVDAFCVEENCYLIVVVPQEGLHFFEYRYVEGFQPALFVPMVGARDTAMFGWGKHGERLMFPVASTQNSVLTEAVVAGNVDPEFDEEAFVDQYENIPLHLSLVDNEKP